jgi:hypothetical protein
MTSRRLGLIPVLSVLGVSAIAVGGRLFGPAATVRTSSTSLYDPSWGLIEPTDRAVMLAWFALAIALAVLVTFVPALSRSRLGRPWVVTLAATAAMVLAIISVTWTIDRSGFWDGIPLGVLFAALIGAALLMASTLVPAALARVGALITAAMAIAYTLPALLQLPSGIRDPFHYRFTSEEIVSVAAGRFPLSDFVPQYTNLLPFPVAPLLDWFPGRAEILVVGWLLALQVIALAIAVTLPILVGGRRFLGPALVVACGPPIMMLGGGVSSSTYFAVMPLRVVLPAALILATYLALKSRPDVGLRRPSRMLSVGVLAGLTALNNPDYGLPAVVAVLVVVFITGRTFRGGAVATGITLAGAAVVFPVYALAGAVVGSPVDWSLWLAFQGMFGAEGSAAVAMEPFGLHIAVVALFVAASVLGFALIWRSRSAAGSFAYRQGLVLALTGGWALLSLPYFVSRSIVPTLIGGYTYAVGLIVAALLPLLHRAIRAVRAGMARDVTAASIGLAFGGLAVAAAVASFAFVSAPSDYVDAQWRGAGGHSAVFTGFEMTMDALLADPANEELRELVDAGEVGQAVDMSGLLELATGFPSVAIASSPDYFDSGPFFAQALCRRSWPDDVDYLLVDSDVAPRFVAEPACADALDLGSLRTFSTGDARFALFPLDAS